MATRLTIANAALVELGQFPLEFATDEDAARFSDPSISDEEDVNQQRVKAVYPRVRHAALNVHPWSWLTETTIPQAAPWPAEGEVGAPSDEQRRQWAYRYRLTYPWIGMVRAVFEKGQMGTPAVDGWTIEGGFMLSTFEVGLIKNQRHTAEEAWPQAFVVYVQLALCAALAMPVLYDQEVQRHYANEAADALADALRLDAQSKPAEVVPYFSFLEARWNGVYGGRRDRRRY